jgi:hypothetical protein
MNMTKYILLFVWALLLLGIVFYIIKQLAFGRRKANETINMSEAVYLAALIISSGLIFQKVIQSIAIAFDNISKIQPAQIVFQSIKTSSAISVTGIIILIISLYIAKLFSFLFFNNRKDIVEFGADNKSFAIMRGALMISTTLVFLQISESIFSYLIPTITIPFYR